MKLKKFKERDNKKIGVIVFTLVCLFLISGAILYRTFAIFEVRTNQNVIKGTVQGMGDVEFAFYINDNIVKTAPSASDKESYVFDEDSSTCTNGASVYWDYQVWGPTVSNLTQTKTKCYLKFKTEYSEPILNGAVPKLKDELTPVTIDENGTVKKADIATEWYNYENQQWANAVITGNSYELLGSNVHGEPKLENDYIHLDRFDDYIDLGLKDYNFGSQMTMVINLKITDFNNINHIFGNQEGAGVGIERADTTSLNIVIYTDEWHRFAINWPDLENFHSIIWRYNGSKLEAWIDGKKEVESDISGNIKASRVPIVIAGNPEGTIDGYYVEVNSNIDVKQAAIFNRAIEDNEIQEISNNFKITNGNGLLKYIDFTNKTYETGEVISEDNIESYFVWIPRYKYQIWNGEEETSQFTDVTNLGSVDNATTKPELNKQKEIKIEFENKHMPVSDGNLKNQWLTHPAFTSFESNGFWVGKFETGYKGATKTAEAEQNIQDTSKIIIKPNVYSWRGIQVSNAFETSKKYKINLDSHMMKNTEWGAVAYLTNSKYGICNGDTCKEVRINNSRNYVTGSSAKNVPTCGYTVTSLDCNQYGESSPGVDNDITLNYKNKDSVISSTTNNYYGIYDMSGGAWEYVFGFMKNESGSLDSANSGFTNFPEEKYYDLYDYDTTHQHYYRGKLGDGTKEFGPFYQVSYNGTSRQVSEWNADSAFFISNEYPWFGRGGDSLFGTEAGLSAFATDNGRATSGGTFRIILTP